MPEKRRRRCGRGCVRCWQNNLKHNNPTAKAHKRRYGLTWDVWTKERTSRRIGRQIVCSASSSAVPPSGPLEVEKILKQERHGSDVFYLLKWKGYPKSQATWEKNSYNLPSSDTITQRVVR